MQHKKAELDTSNFPEFKKAEKKYRHYLNKKTDFSELIDLNNFNSSMENICTKSEATDTLTNKQYSVFTFDFPKGLSVIKNFLTIPEQLLLGGKCINEFFKKPNRTNLYIYEDHPGANKNEPLPTYDLNQYLEKDPNKYYFDRKIRWSNIGFQYDWNNRLYPTGQTSIPVDLQQYPLRVLKLLNFSGYTPECVIVNYYNKKDNMGGHLDDGEVDQVSPIISFSLGLSCVFLIGGKTKDIKPHAIKLEAGDVLIMSGESRLSYHGVPRVLEDSFKEESYLQYIRESLPEVIEQHNVNYQGKKNEFFVNDEIHVINYMKDNRLNFNFRQVYPKDRETAQDAEGSQSSEITQDTETAENSS